MVMSPFSPPSLFEHTFDHAVVYGDAEKEVVLHEGSVRILGNGWVEVSDGRVFSPNAVHHIDGER
ncbi:hypothetical protein ACFQJC_15685 [Haloferax namakaokahaiae]|uniref:Uncharacterized protein n=1 Tax=Haloferax namakaokahaiae TaxID=1748331 RepID=A0ABD5ZIC0_9EURY